MQKCIHYTKTIHLFNWREAAYKSSKLVHSYACLIYYRSQTMLRAGTCP